MTLVMCYVGLTKFMTEVGIVTMASLLGDGVAAMVGLEYGKHTYKLPLVGGHKSIEGTMGCAVGTTGGLVLFSYMCGIDINGGYWRMATYGCISALIEATALQNYDNVILAVAMEMTAKYYTAKSGAVIIV